VAGMNVSDQHTAWLTCAPRLGCVTSRRCLLSTGVNFDSRELKARRTRAPRSAPVGLRRGTKRGALKTLKTAWISYSEIVDALIRQHDLEKQPGSLNPSRISLLDAAPQQ